jgi:stage V sporulation protein G
VTITEVKIRKTYPEGKLRATVSITVGNGFAIHDIRVIETLLCFDAE